MTDSDDSRLIGVDAVLDLIEKATGHRPRRSTIHSNVAKDAMPKPALPGLWSEEEIRAWLSRRDRARITKIQQQIRKAATAGGPALDRAVKAARESGLSWQQIGEAIPGRRGSHLTKQAAHSRFRHLET